VSWHVVTPNFRQNIIENENEKGLKTITYIYHLSKMIDNFDFNKINGIRESIENMAKFNQIEILRILTKRQDVIVNENKYGIHINLSELPGEIIEELLVYISYVNTQEIELNKIEKQQEDYKNIYFMKDNKDISAITR
jgi:hypothetical protein